MWFPDGTSLTSIPTCNDIYAVFDSFYANNIILTLPIASMYPFTHVSLCFRILPPNTANY